MSVTAVLAERNERWGLLALAAALAVMFGLSYVDLYRLVWHSDDQGHGPIIVAVTAWLIWRRASELAALPSVGAGLAGWAVLLVGLALYVLGRSQSIVQAEALSHIIVLAGLVMVWRGWAGLRLLAFPLFFLLFMVPLPGTLVQMLTVPLKSAVSWVAEHLLFMAGYPIARSGVLLQVGPYQLMVADACAGLNSMFTLESLGLLYMNVMGYTHRLRNVLLALLIIPISFTANVVRVIILVLVTYYFGDAAGQGFIHGFAGMVLFGVAFVLMLGTDKLLGQLLGHTGAQA